jgi:HD-like signal output (HDOD) protein
MATTTTAKVNRGTPVAPRVLLDEDLWFGLTDAKAAEDAAAKSMAATAGTVLGAKPFPESARRLAELSSRDDGQVGEMVQVLEQDPALSAKLLRVVNSAGFGLRQRCTSVRHAVTLVGSKHLNQMATTAAVLDLFDSESGPAVSVLEHSAVVGAFCRYLGAHQGLPAEDLFTAGALHDIGKLMLLEAFGERYHLVFDQCLEHPDTLFAIERAEYGFDHGVLAAHVLKAWNIPEPIPKVVAWHHEPTRAYESSTLNA